MITPTHVVTNAFLSYRQFRAPSDSGPTSFLQEKSNARWFVAGGMAPDVGLLALSVGAAAFFPLVRGMSLEDTMQYAFNDLFFNDPFWLTIQNTLHSPVVVGAMAIAGKVLGRKRLMSFGLGCLLHTAMDIPVHHNDGPLVFFPFNWSYRFNSPVSYYDADHFGQFVAPIDLAITLIGGAYLASRWWKHRSALPSLPT